jgi:hypothetical protein
MPLRTLLAVAVLLALTPAAAAPVASGQDRPQTTPLEVNKARGGGRGFGGIGSRSRPAFGRRARRGAGRQPAAPRQARRRPLFGQGFFGSVLRALGIAYLIHLLFGWGPGGGSPLGLLIVLGVILWLATRRRRRRPLPY